MSKSLEIRSVVRRGFFSAVCVVGASLAFAGRARAVPVYTDEAKGASVNLGVLLQPWFQMSAPGSSGQGSPGVGAPDGESPSFDFFLRRARIMVWGSVDKDLSYFVETDQPNIGKGGDFTSRTFIQDAFLTYQFMPEFKLDAGMMLLPLTHHSIEGAVGQHLIDYHAQLVLFPGSFVFRDVGVQARGIVANSQVQYRVGLFEGVRGPVPPPAGAPPPLNPSGLPRITGQVRYNIMGSEPDFFLKGIYFSPTPIVNVGIGGDYQRKAVYSLGGTPKRYWALNLDAFAEYPLNADDEVVAKAAFFDYAEGTPGLARGGVAFFIEGGYRHAWLEPVAYIEYLRGRGGSVKLFAPHGGVNFWINKHTFNIKADLGYRKTDVLTAAGTTATAKDIFATAQTQLFF